MWKEQDVYFLKRCLEEKFWTEAVNSAAYLKNKSVASSVKKTPYEMRNGRKPHLENIRIFCISVPKEKRRKLDRKSKKHILVGFCENVKDYREHSHNK